MYVLNDIKQSLSRVKLTVSRFKEDIELTRYLENYKSDIELSKLENNMKNSVDYKFAGMISPEDKILFRGLQGIDYKNVLDGHPYFSVGIFILPKFSRMPLHDHKNMLVYTKLLCGRAEIKSYDKLSNLDLDEHEFEVKETENIIYKEGDLTVLTPLNKNIHEMLALEDTAFLDIILPDYTDDNTCNYFKFLEGNKNNKHILKKINYI